MIMNKKEQQEDEDAVHQLLTQVPVHAIDAPGVHLEAVFEEGEGEESCNEVEEDLDILGQLGSWSP